MGQNGGANGAMRSAEHSANGGGKTMHNSQARVGQSEAAQQSGVRHPGTSRRVVAVLKSREKTLLYDTQSVGAEGIRYRIGSPAHIRLDELRERIEAAGSGRGRG